MAGHRYLLVGGFGFLGRHLIERFERVEPHAGITVLTRSAPTYPWTKYNFVLESELDKKHLWLFATCHDFVVHMASTSVPGASSIRGEITANVLPALELITHLHELNPNLRFVYLSSGGQVYGDASLGKISEIAELIPMSPYGLGKIMVEQGLRYLAASAGASIGILRVGNAIGKWQHNTRQGIVNVTIESMLLNRPVTVYGNGNELRDYVGADAVAEAIHLACKKQSLFDIWNIGSGKGTKTIDVINTVAKVMGKPIEIQYLPRRAVDPRSVVLDCKHAETSLGWKTSLQLDELISKTVSAKLKK